MLEKLPSGVGAALSGHRAGLEQTVFQRLDHASDMAPISLRAPAFGADGSIPAKYTADGIGISPPLEWHGIPESATSLAVIVEDADSPTPHPLVHAIVVNLDPREPSLAEGALKSSGHAGAGVSTGRNSYLSHAWLPPDPPPGHGAHRYVFQLYALEGPPLPDSPGRHALVEVIEKRAIAAGAAIGTYERPPRA